VAKQKENNKTLYSYPTRFGSHKSMIVKELENGKVVCKDEFGEYTTSFSRCDDGTADPSRWDLKFRNVKFEKS